MNTRHVQSYRHAHVCIKHILIVLEIGFIVMKHVQFAINHVSSDIDKVI